MDNGMSVNTLFQALESHIAKLDGVEKRDAERRYKDFRKNLTAGYEKVSGLIEVGLQELEISIIDYVNGERDLFFGVIEDLNFNFTSLFGSEFEYHRLSRKTTFLKFAHEQLGSYIKDLEETLSNELEQK